MYIHFIFIFIFFSQRRGAVEPQAIEDEVYSVPRSVVSLYNKIPFFFIDRYLRFRHHKLLKK